jgi:glyoxylase-like metal-dependent hydrolase (beta-lactamase superfamily II)
MNVLDQMFRIEPFSLGPLATNAYLLTRPDTKQAVVIDPGMNPQSLLKRIAGLQVEAILLTHAHFDHIGGVEAIRKQHGCPVYLHDAEADWLTDPRKNGSAMWPELGEPFACEPAEYALEDGQTLELLGGVRFQVLHTPGHSPGSVSFLHGNRLFGGDVLFRLGVGRTDLRGGSSRELHDSIHRKLFVLPDEVQVFPGHGPKTTIGYEKEHNPHV